MSERLRVSLVLYDEDGEDYPGPDDPRVNIGWSGGRAGDASLNIGSGDGEVSIEGYPHQLIRIAIETIFQLDLAKFHPRQLQPYDRFPSPPEELIELLRSYASAVEDHDHRVTDDLNKVYRNKV